VTYLKLICSSSDNPTCDTHSHRPCIIQHTPVLRSVCCVFVLSVHTGLLLKWTEKVNKGKAVPQHTDAGAAGERRYSSYSFTTSELDGGEWSASRIGWALRPGNDPPGAHPASCTMGTGGPFPGLKRGRGLKLTTHPHLVPKSKLSRSYTSSPPSAFIACNVTA
jgi:hypothetical protein